MPITWSTAPKKCCKDLGDKAPADLKSQVEDHISKVRQVLNNDDAQAIQKAADDLSQVLQQLGSAAYQQAGPPPSGPGDGSGSAGPQEGPEGPDDGEVVDGEFRNA